MVGITITLRCDIGCLVENYILHFRIPKILINAINQLMGHLNLKLLRINIVLDHPNIYK